MSRIIRFPSPGLNDMDDFGCFGTFTVGWRCHHCCCRRRRRRHSFCMSCTMPGLCRSHWTLGVAVLVGLFNVTVRVWCCFSRQHRLQKDLVRVPPQECVVHQAGEHDKYNSLEYVLTLSWRLPWSSRCCRS